MQVSISATIRPGHMYVVSPSGEIVWLNQARRLLRPQAIGASLGSHYTLGPCDFELCVRFKVWIFGFEGSGTQVTKTSEARTHSKFAS